MAALGLAACDETMPRGAEYPSNATSTQQAQAEVSAASVVEPSVEPSAAGAPALSEPGTVPDDSNANGAGQEIAIGVDTATYSDADPSALTEFRPVLDPYGAWYEDPSYGVVWTPSPTVVGADFAPYVSAGRWTYNNEYVWVSDYDWGWAPFHYGRWVYIAGRGWSWIPGRRYSGAWVVWRVGDPGYGYIGWAPAPPTWYWRGGYAVGLVHSPPAPYAFCPVRSVFDPGVGRRVVTGSQVTVIGAQTRPWVPASPTVNGDPSRVVASPQVGVSSVRPHAGLPSGSSHVTAVPALNGPSPRDIGIAAANLPPPPGDHAGLARAQSLAQPRAAAIAVTPRVIPQRVPMVAEPALRIPQAQPRPADAPTRLPDLHALQPQRVPNYDPGPRAFGAHTLPESGSSPVVRQAPVPAPSPAPLPQIASPQPPPVMHQAPQFQAQPRVSAPVFQAQPRLSAPVFQAQPRVSAPVFRAPAPQMAPQIQAAPRPVFRSPTPSVSPQLRAPSIVRRK